SIDMSAVPANAMVAFRATSDYGNNLFIDDVNLRTGQTTGIPTVFANNEVRVFPNPAKDVAHLSFVLNQGTKVQVSVVDALGRVVANVADEQMAKGARDLTISTVSLASGTYTIKIQTEQGFTTERLSVVK